MVSIDFFFWWSCAQVTIIWMPRNLKRKKVEEKVIDDCSLQIIDDFFMGIKLSLSMWDQRDMCFTDMVASTGEEHIYGPCNLLRPWIAGVKLWRARHKIWLRKNTISSIVLAGFFLEFVSFKFWALQKLGVQESQYFSENYLWCCSLINMSRQLFISYRQSQHLDVRKGHFIG